MFLEQSCIFIFLTDQNFDFELGMAVERRREKSRSLVSISEDRDGGTDTDVLNQGPHVSVSMQQYDIQSQFHQAVPVVGSGGTVRNSISNNSHMSSIFTAMGQPHNSISNDLAQIVDHAMCKPESSDSLASVQRTHSNLQDVLTQETVDIIEMKHTNINPILIMFVIIVAVIVGTLSVLIHYSVVYFGVLVGINQADHHPSEFLILNYFCNYEMLTVHELVLDDLGTHPRPEFENTNGFGLPIPLFFCLYMCCGALVLAIMYSFLRNYSEYTYQQLKGGGVTQAKIILESGSSSTWLKKKLASKIFGYLARCEAKFCTTTLKNRNLNSKLDQNTETDAAKI